VGCSGYYAFKETLPKGYCARLHQGCARR